MHDTTGRRTNSAKMLDWRTLTFTNTKACATAIWLVTSGYSSSRTTANPRNRHHHVYAL